MRGLGAAIGCCVLALLPGCRARPPSRLERVLAARVKRLTVGGSGMTNPLPSTPENVDRGRRDFSHYCVVCHGLDGRGTGVPFFEAMAPPIPRLDSPEVQGYRDGQLEWVIENGLFPSGMPAARGILNEDEMWRIVLFLRNLPPEGSLGDPPAYREERPAGGDRRPSAAVPMAREGRPR